MAEAGLILSILGLAAEGLKISETISAFLDRVGSASKDIQAIVTDVQSTSETLQKLADCLGNDGNSSLANEEWKSSTEAHLSTCRKIFSEIQSTISNHSVSQLESDTKFSRLKRIKVAFKHERVVGWKVKMDSVKTDFSFKINVLNLARHEKERQNERTHLRKKAEIDRLEYEKESLGLEIAYKKMMFAQKRAACFSSTPSSSDVDSDLSAKEEAPRQTGETVGRKNVPNKASASQPVSEGTHEGRPNMTKHGLVARRRRQQAQARGLRRQSSLRFDLVSSVEAQLSRKLAGTVDRKSLRALIQVLQEGKAEVERLKTCSAASTALKQEGAASDPPLPAEGAVLELLSESGQFQESEWNSEEDGNSVNAKSNRDAQATKLETIASSQDETTCPVSLHRSTTLDVSLDNFAPRLGSEGKRMQCDRIGSSSTPNKPKGTGITPEPRPVSFRAMTAASASWTAGTETLPTESFETAVHLKGPDDKSEVHLYQPGGEQSTRAQESATGFTIKKNPISALEHECIGSPPEVKLAKPEKIHEDAGTASLSEIKRTHQLEAWSLRHSSLESKLRLRLPFRWSNLWTRLYLNEDDLAWATGDDSTADSLWKDLALLSDYQKKQIDHLISMRRKQDNPGLVTLWDEDKQANLKLEAQWFLHALNSHPRNVSNGFIVNLVVVIGRYPTGLRELGFDRDGQEPLPQNIAKLSLWNGKSTQQDNSEVGLIQEDRHDSKKPKHSQETIDPDPFGVSKLFTPTGKTLDLSGYNAGPSNEAVQLPPIIIDSEPPRYLGSTPLENLRRTNKVGEKRDLSSPKLREVGSYFRGRRRYDDSRPPSHWEDSSDTPWAVRPVPKQMMLADSYARRPPAEAANTETANNHINQMLQKWTNLEQATKTTEVQKQRQRRSEKRKKMEKDGYVSLSDDPDDRTFIVGDQVNLKPRKPRNSINRTSSARPPPRWEAPSKIGKKEIASLHNDVLLVPELEAESDGEWEITHEDDHYIERKKVVDTPSREIELKWREKDLARRERMLLGVPARVGPTNVEAEAQMLKAQYSSSVERAGFSD